jgi:hypothetical protein
MDGAVNRARREVRGAPRCAAAVRRGRNTPDDPGIQRMVRHEKSTRPPMGGVPSAAMRRTALLLVPLLGLGAGATALAQGGGGSPHPLQLPGGCLRGVRVIVRFEPRSGQTLNVHVRSGGKEVVHLTGVTRDASVTLRLPRAGGRVDVSGATSDGDAISAGRTYHRCAPATPREPRPGPQVVSGGGEG